MKKRKYDWFILFADLLIIASWIWISFLTSREFINTDIVWIKIMFAFLFTTVFGGFGYIVVFGIFVEWIKTKKLF